MNKVACATMCGAITTWSFYALAKCWAGLLTCRIYSICKASSSELG